MLTKESNGVVYNEFDTVFELAMYCLDIQASFKNNFLYCEQSDSNWKLIPSIYRKSAILDLPLNFDNSKTIFKEHLTLSKFVEGCDLAGLQKPNLSQKVH